jgi:ArsR family transcriptional regulator
MNKEDYKYMKLLNKYAQIFHAMSDEFRLKVLLYLHVNGERCVCDIENYFGIGQSSISYHLKILCEAKIINKRRVAVWNYYSLNQDSVVYRLLKSIFKNIDAKECKDNASNE